MLCSTRWSFLFRLFRFSDKFCYLLAMPNKSWKWRFQHVHCHSKINIGRLQQCVEIKADQIVNSATQNTNKYFLNIPLRGIYRIVHNAHSLYQFFELPIHGAKHFLAAACNWFAFGLAESQTIFHHFSDSLAGFRHFFSNYQQNSKILQ